MSTYSVERSYQYFLHLDSVAHDIVRNNWEGATMLFLFEDSGPLSAQELEQLLLDQKLMSDTIKDTLLHMGRHGLVMIFEGKMSLTPPGNIITKRLLESLQEFEKNQPLLE